MLTVRDIMTTNVFTVEADASAEEAAWGLTPPGTVVAPGAVLFPKPEPKGEAAEAAVPAKKAKSAAGSYSEIFGKDNFFIEIQDQGLPEEHRIHKDLFKLESDLGIPMVATNDSHYLCEGDAHAHDVLICVQTGKSVHDTNRLKFHGDQFFVKSADEMGRVFKDAPQVLTRTMGIAERCNVKIEKVGNPFPTFAVPEGHTIDSYFEHVSREGMSRRFELIREQEKLGRLKKTISDYEQRLTMEIKLIQQMKFSGYFLTRKRTIFLWARGVDRRRGRWSHTRWASRTSIRCKMNSSSSASSIQSACRCRIST